MKKLNIAVASGLLSVLMPVSMVFATSDGSSVTIDTTGANSYNKASVKNVCMTSVSQSNKSSVVNQIMVEQNTGGNTANKNTGDGSVKTGDATVAIAIDNAGNSNELEGGDCCCEQASQSTTVSVMNTGYKSTNKTTVKNVTKTSKKQKNVSSKLNAVGVGQNTGSNASDKNTGSGEVDTGSTDVVVEVHNEGDSNTLN